MTNQIRVSNNGIIIDPYYKGQCRELEKMTSIYDKVYHKRIPLTGVFLEDECLFATHRHSIPMLKHLLPGYEVVFEDRIRPQPVYPFSLNEDKRLNDYQFNIFNKVAEMPNEHAYYFNMQTGFGKTVISVFYSGIWNLKTMVICHSTKILRQWKRTYTEIFNMDPSRVLIVNTSKVLENVLNGEFNTDQYDVWMCTHKMIHSFCSNNSWCSLSTVFKNIGIGLIAFDEANLNMMNTVLINAFTNVQRTLYLSADCNQAAFKKKDLYMKMLHGVPILTVDQELTDATRYINCVVIEYNSNPTMNEQLSIKNRYGFSHSNYMRYQFDKKAFYDILHNVMMTINKSNTHHSKILIMVGLIEHVNELTERMRELYSDYKIGRYYSELSDEEKEDTTNRAEIIIATYQSFLYGIDIKDIRYVISIDQVNEIYDNQASGRARPPEDGSDCFYFIFVDYGFEYCRKKLPIRLSYLTTNKVKKLYRIRY